MTTRRALLASVTLAIAALLALASPAAAAWDPSVLGVSWSTDFTAIAANDINVKTDGGFSPHAVGDGTTDDTTAVRAAIARAVTLGGGTVYFPAGTYKLIVSSAAVTGDPLLIPSNVILRGDGPSTSRLMVNDLHADDQGDWIGTWGGISFLDANTFTITSTAGLTDLGITAVNGSSNPCALLWNRGTTGSSSIFFNNVDIQLGNCKSFWFDGITNFLVKNSTITGTSTLWAPVNATHNAHASYIGNTITYLVGRVHLNFTTNLIVQGNTLTRDADNKSLQAGTAVESGGIELAFCDGVLLTGNTITTLNAPADNNFADGEAITSQQSIVQTILDLGTITSLTSTTIVDTSALWSTGTTDRLAVYPTVVAMISGSATGEWRTVTGINTGTKTLTINSAWTHTPAIGDLFSLFTWTLKDAEIRGNTLVGNPNGIVIFDGCTGCVIDDNVLVNSRGIMLRVADTDLNPSAYPEGRRWHHVAISNRIQNNLITNTSGARPAYLVVDAEAFAATDYRGMGFYDTRVSDNTVTVWASDPSKAYDQPEISQEGYFPCFLWIATAANDPLSTIFRSSTEWQNTTSATVTYAGGFVGYTTHSCTVSSGPAGSGFRLRMRVK